MRMRIVPGRLVFNLVPQRAPSKGDALIDLRARERCDTALYVGDDVTDEDVFRPDQPGRLLAVRVGESRSSVAPYFIRDQRDQRRAAVGLTAKGRELDHASPSMVERVVQQMLATESPADIQGTVRVLERLARNLRAEVGED